MARRRIDPDAKVKIVESAGTMLAVGADWSTIMTELYRFTWSKGFSHWKREDLPSLSTLERWLMREADTENIRELKEKRIKSIKTRLQSKALTMALNGDRTMLIFCLKNICGWSDTPDVKNEGGEDDKTPEQRRAEIKNIKAILDDEDKYTPSKKK
jgi:hypothetical protein